MNKSFLVLLALPTLVSVGCIQVKTESEIKPIHITMDVNLKVDKELDRQFSDERRTNSAPQGDFKEIKAMLDRQAAGIDNKAMLTPRASATDDDKILIAEANARRRQRFADIARESGVAIEAIQKRHVGKMRERIPAGSGVWYQEEDGVWKQK